MTTPEYYRALPVGHVEHGNAHKPTTAAGVYERQRAVDEGRLIVQPVTSEPSADKTEADRTFECAGCAANEPHIVGIEKDFVRDQNDVFVAYPKSVDMTADTATGGTVRIVLDEIRAYIFGGKCKRVGSDCVTSAQCQTSVTALISVYINEPDIAAPVMPNITFTNPLTGAAHPTAAVATTLPTGGGNGANVGFYSLAFFQSLNCGASNQVPFNLEEFSPQPATGAWSNRVYSNGGSGLGFDISVGCEACRKGGAFPA